MNGPYEARLRALEDDNERRQDGLERRLTSIEDNAERRERLQESRHTDNSARLKKIEDAFLETAVYFKVGRWVVTVASVIGTAVITALATKWLGAKP